MNIEEDQIVCKHFKILKKIGSGGFGEIFLALNTLTNEEVAVKCESPDLKHPQLFYEAKLYQYMHADTNTVEKGIPKIYYAAVENGMNVMVMDICGPSLESLHKMCGGYFSMKTTLMIVDSLLSRIEYFHSRQFIHRDIKPENFLIGAGKKAHKIFIIDFGLCKKYVDRENNHIPYREDKGLTGTARYASINSHLGIEQSRRDDMLALGYLFVYCAKGQLPWQNLKANTKQDKNGRILEKKISTPIEVLCKGLPPVFGRYIAYCQTLKFEQKPDYDFCREMFKNFMEKLKYDFDYDYDWIKKGVLLKKMDEKDGPINTSASPVK